MEVNVLQSTSLGIAIKAARRCWDSEGKSDSADAPFNKIHLGDKDKELFRMLIAKGHESALEHIVFTFDIQGISRSCLQELSRHRISSLSVQSTRYTLKKLLTNTEYSWEDLLVSTGDSELDYEIQNSVLKLLDFIDDGVSNDILKYAIPEAFKTSLIWTINARSLRNFMKLRTSKRALKEIRELAFAIYDEIKADYRILFEDILLEVNSEQ